MTRQQRLHEIININLSPVLFNIEDETHQHSVPADAESHFKSVIVSERFNTLNRVARHRMVNQLVKEEFSKGLHALSLHLYTPTEWEKKNSAVPASPVCKGGSRHQSKEQV